MIMRDYAVLTNEEVTYNEINQRMVQYTLASNFKCNFQTLTKDYRENKWGQDVKLEFELYTQTKLPLGSIIYANGFTYEVGEGYEYTLGNIYPIKRVEVDLVG